jgi:hypothetical protein
MDCIVEVNLKVHNRITHVIDNPSVTQITISLYHQFVAIINSSRLCQLVSYYNYVNYSIRPQIFDA